MICVAYQKALLDYGMLILNFLDAIAEGDGEFFRCWKYFLMYLKHQGRSSTKYALEGLYLMFQVHALLSPRAAHRLVWNRSVKNKRGSSNIPLDLMLEFYNRIIKEAVKKLGPGASAKSYAHVKPSIISGLNLQQLYQWINEHKSFMIFYRRAR